jgi:uncharacterized membrane protein
MGFLAVCRMMTSDFYWPNSAEYFPIFNETTLPALGVVACVLGSVMLTWRSTRGMPRSEQTAALIVGVVAALLLGWVVSWDIFRWMVVHAPYYFGLEPYWSAQVAISVWWGIYATVLLAIGFRAQRALPRWIALAIYGVTCLKVFLLDMSGVSDLYRVVALFALAILLGGAAWGYQKMTQSAPPAGESP